LGDNGLKTLPDGFLDLPRLAWVGETDQPNVVVVVFHALY